jgi:hypothetical protein
MLSLSLEHSDVPKSNFLSSSPQTVPSARQGPIASRSNPLFRGSSSAQAGEEDSGRQHSLAHELAVALMPEPSAGSMLLAEEFGIEYDEGAEGIDESDHENRNPNERSSFPDESGSQSFTFDSGDPSSQNAKQTPQDLIIGNSEINVTRNTSQQEHAMVILARDIESTDKFLSHLRCLDIDSGPSSTQPRLEKMALDVIRRINDTSRDREGQVRELLECELEFRKIAGEVGGTEVLGQLEELAGVEGLSEEPSANGRPEAPEGHTVELELCSNRSQEHNELNVSEAKFFTPSQALLEHAPRFYDSSCPPKTIPQLADLRTFTSSLVVSLATISEQAQVNGAATTEAGRKLRALKNKLGEWRTDWDNAEVSRMKIERWEAGNGGGECRDGTRRDSIQRADGRKVVQEHLQAFELALAEAAIKTKHLMANS